LENKREIHSLKPYFENLAFEWINKYWTWNPNGVKFLNCHYIHGIKCFYGHSLAKSNIIIKYTILFNVWLGTHEYTSKPIIKTVNQFISSSGYAPLVDKFLANITPAKTVQWKKTTIKLP
jgi:hypothetical protein